MFCFAVLMAGGVLLVLTVALTDACEFSDKYFRTAFDVDLILRRMGLLVYDNTENVSSSMPPSPVAFAVAGCLLPGQERDIAKILGIESAFSRENVFLASIKIKEHTQSCVKPG